MFTNIILYQIMCFFKFIPIIYNCLLFKVEKKEILFYELSTFVPDTRAGDIF